MSDTGKTADAVVVEFLEELAKNPQSAADELEKLAHELLAAAAQLRAQSTQEQAIRSPGGFGDKVRIAVVGPDGQKVVEVS